MSPNSTLLKRNVVAMWEAFYIEDKSVDLDILGMPSRSPTPIPKSNDLRGQSDDLWGARGPYFRPILGATGVRAGLKDMGVRARDSSSVGAAHDVVQQVHLTAGCP